MPRAHRHFLTGHVWHITHRCHKKEFLLKFAKDRDLWRHWLFEARKRYGLCVFNYIITSNHIHLLVRDRGHGEISKSMQLIAGRTAQEYNRRKNRNGAYRSISGDSIPIKQAMLILCFQSTNMSLKGINL
jgi:putative transposase